MNCGPLNIWSYGQFHNHAHGSLDARPLLQFENNVNVQRAAWMHKSFCCRRRHGLQVENADHRFSIDFIQRKKSQRRTTSRLQTVWTAKIGRSTATQWNLHKNFPMIWFASVYILIKKSSILGSILFWNFEWHFILQSMREDSFRHFFYVSSFCRILFPISSLILLQQYTDDLSVNPE